MNYRLWRKIKFIQQEMDRSSHRRCPVSCSWKWRKIHKKCLCFNKVARWRPEILSKARFHHRSFPESYAKLLIIAFWQNTSRWMLLKVAEVIEIIFNVSLPNKFVHLFPHLQLIYFHFHSFATDMTKMSLNIFLGMFYWRIRWREMCKTLNLSWNSGKSSSRVKIMFLKI